MKMLIKLDGSTAKRPLDFSCELAPAAPAPAEAATRQDDCKSTQANCAESEQQRQWRWPSDSHD